MAEAPECHDDTGLSFLNDKKTGGQPEGSSNPEEDTKSHFQPLCSIYLVVVWIIVFIIRLLRIIALFFLPSEKAVDAGC